jgi:CheY-like chemotaxis protein
MAATSKVLIIEDYRDAALSLRLLLELLGYDVRIAGTGRAGVQIAQEWLPNMIICDIQLPDMDGYCVARTLRQDSTTAGAVLIALTASGVDWETFQAGFDYHLTKPTRPGELVQLLENCHEPEPLPT